MLYHFTYGSFVHTFIEVKEHGYRIAHWWEYFCILIIYSLGYLFLSAGALETVEFNKILGVLVVRRFKL